MKDSFSASLAIFAKWSAYLDDNAVLIIGNLFAKELTTSSTRHIQMATNDMIKCSSVLPPGILGVIGL